MIFAVITEEVKVNQYELDKTFLVLGLSFFLRTCIASFSNLESITQASIACYLAVGH